MTQSWDKGCLRETEMSHRQDPLKSQRNTTYFFAAERHDLEYSKLAIGFYDNQWTQERILLT